MTGPLQPFNLTRSEHQSYINQSQPICKVLFPGTTSGTHVCLKGVLPSEKRERWARQACGIPQDSWAFWRSLWEAAASGSGGATHWEEQLDLSRGTEDKLEPVKTDFTYEDSCNLHLPLTTSNLDDTGQVLPMELLTCLAQDSEKFKEQELWIHVCPMPTQEPPGLGPSIRT